MYDEKYKQDFTEEELKNEEWKDVGECKGYEQFKGLYEISSLGRLRSLDKWVNHSSGNGRCLRKGKLLKQQLDSYGYLYVILRNHGLFKVIKSHRAVALAFLPNSNNLPEVNHKDEDKMNNRVDNLEWCTSKYNVNYGTRSERARDKISGSVGKSINQYSKQGNLLHT